MIKLVVSDMDGTFLDDKKSISEENKKAVGLLKEQDIHFCICTGRLYASAHLIAQELGNEFPIISCNGGFIKNPSTDRILYHKPLPTELARKIVETIMKYDVVFHFYDEDTVFSNKKEYTAKTYINRFGHLEEKPVKVVVSEKISDYVHDKIYKVILFTNDSAVLQSIWDEIKSLTGVVITQSNHNNLEIVSDNVSKGNAVRMLADELGITSDEIFVIGDQMNDMSMFAAAKYSVAMGNGTDALKEKAYFVTKDNNQSGFAHAVNRLVFGKE